MMKTKTLIHGGALCSFWATCFFLLAVIVTANAQQSSPGAADNRMIFTKVERPAQFPGGEDSLKMYLEKNLREPAETRKKNRPQTISATIIVSETGAVENVRIVNSNDKALNAEVVRVIENMPDWIPGWQNGRSVATEFTLPVTFPKKPE